jgi:hypothetical protein
MAVADADLVFTPLAKARGDKQIAYGVVYEPDVADGQGEAATANEIESAAHDYMLKAQVVGVDHEGPADAQVVESYLAPQDLTLGGESVSKGSWVLGVKVNDSALWASIKKGDRVGFSMGGHCQREGAVAEGKAASMESIAKESALACPPELIEKSEKDPHIDANGDFIGGFDGCVAHFQDKGLPKANAEKLCGYIASRKSLDATKSMEKSEQENAMTPEEIAKVKADNEALAVRVATLEAQAKADTEAKAKAQAEADEKAIAADLAAYKSKREAQAAEMAHKIAEKVLAERAKAAPVHTDPPDLAVDVDDLDPMPEGERIAVSAGAKEGEEKSTDDL